MVCCWSSAGWNTCVHYTHNAPSRWRYQSTCASGGSASYPISPILCQTSFNPIHSNTYGLLGEDGSLRKTLDNEGVVILFSKSSKSIFTPPSYTTHTEKEQLEIGRHLDEKLAVVDAVGGGDGEETSGLCSRDGDC